MIQWHYGHAVIVTAVWGLIPPANQVLNDQLTTLKVPFGVVSQHVHSITTLIEFQQVAQNDYYKSLVMTHVNFGNEIFHVLEVANEVHRPSLAT